jgi:hypothetical protein
MEMGHRVDQERLCCWKDIAQFMGKGVRTLQRWELDFGLPVRRLIDRKGIDHTASVVAYPSELNEWVTSKWSNRKTMNRAEGITHVPKLRENLEKARLLRSEQASLRSELRAARVTLIQICHTMVDTLGSKHPSPTHPRPSARACPWE